MENDRRRAHQSMVQEICMICRAHVGEVVREQVWRTAETCDATGSISRRSTQRAEAVDAEVIGRAKKLLGDIWKLSRAQHCDDVISRSANLRKESPKGRSR